MGKKVKEPSSSYITRNKALKKLQLSLADFRRLCILKGIYPRDPKNKRKILGGSSAPTTFFHIKDIQFLSHEPLLAKFRQFKAFAKRLRKLIGKRNWSAAKKFEQTKPLYTLDHIIKERYPSFLDALRDLDDALSMVFLFATLPVGTPESVALLSKEAMEAAFISAQVSETCQQLSREFSSAVIASGALKKVFLSIKGIYYQAEIKKQLITWIVPYEFTQEFPSDVDLRVMLTFLELHQTLLGFVNFKLFKDFNICNGIYPPKFKNVSCSFELEDDQNDGKLSIMDNSQRGVFSGLVFFLSRETPRNSLEFIIRACGGKVGYAHDPETSPFSEQDTAITHHVIDRQPSDKMFFDNGRVYIQPQWVYDSINAKELLSDEKYRPGKILPPHLSPFVELSTDDYDPNQPVDEEEPVEETENLDSDPDMQENSSSEDENESEEELKHEKKKVDLEKARKDMAISMLSKKNRNILAVAQKRKEKKLEEVKKLKERRAAAGKKKLK